MYLNQFAYDNAEPQSPSLREIAESRVLAKLDANDAETVAELGEHASLWLADEANDLLQSLAMVGPSKFSRILAAVSAEDADMAAALQKLAAYCDKARAEYIEEKAGEMLAEEAQ